MTDAYDASDPRHVRQAAKAARGAEIASNEIIRGLMSLSAGRAWVLELLEVCHIFSTSFDRDAGVMAFQEGERHIGLRLLISIMAACPDQYTVMMRERDERDHTASARRNRDPGGSEPDSGGEDPGDAGYDIPG